MLTVVVAAATATCGLLLIGGVAPSADTTVLPVAAPVEAIDDSVTTTTATTTVTATTTTAATTSTTEAPADSTTTTVVTTVPETTAPALPSVVPIAVEASNTVVGAGGVVTFTGRCEVGEAGPRGSVLVWVIGDEVDEIDTGVTSADWSYTWTAPTEEDEFGSFTFQFWCGDPSSHDGGYPAELQHRVDMVAVIPPSTTILPVEPGPGTPDHLIPETD